MRIFNKVIVSVLFVVLCGGVNANPALDTIAQLEKNKIPNSPNVSIPMSEKQQKNNVTSKNAKNAPRYITLSNGKRMNIADWRIVHFMSSKCGYCHQFNPKLKQISEQTGIPIYTYSFDGQGDESFPLVFDANEDVLREFFAELPRATPTDFLINVNNLVTLPLSQGDISYQAFLQRLDEVFIYIDENLKGIADKKSAK